MSCSRKWIVYLIGTYRKGQEALKKDEVEWEGLEKKMITLKKKKTTYGENNQKNLYLSYSLLKK